DNMTKTQHKPNQELIGQGIGNTVAAFFGGLPGAGATIRTVVNINSGGKTRLSGMIAGVFLFSIILVLGTIASKIPAGVLAGILITVGIGVMDYRGLKTLPKMEMSEKIILLTVLILTVFWQLVFAVAVGLVMAALVFLKRFSDTSGNDVSITSLADIVKDNWIDGINVDSEVVKKVYFKDFSGPIFFGIIEEFKNSVLRLPDIDYLIIRLEKVAFIDQSGLYALEETLLDLQKSNVVIVISGPNQNVVDQLSNVHIIPDFVSESHIFHDDEKLRVWLNEEMSRS
ncbi:MAG: SulP family inorganic anion transporter, partial [Flavobacteriales bacterium]|nr:SulP family inorganic anion transporter [Flavobacteriales bacterium]